MLQNLLITNYALIDDLEVDFTNGLSIITGETGAGKSILLGGLALVLGKRADLSSLKIKEKKCIVEAQFKIDTYQLESFFTINDLDYEPLTIIRREILPSGKSRAFINDTPIVLSVLNELSKKLIDVHSQHQTLQLSSEQYQFQIIDALTKNEDYLSSYKRGLLIYKKQVKELEEIKITQEQSKQQFDYHHFLFEELEKAELQENEQEVLEQNLDKLNNVESIKQNLSEAISLIYNEQAGILEVLNTLKNNLLNIAPFSKEYDSLYNRIESAKIEFDDIAKELEIHNENVDYNANEIEKSNDRLQLIYDLQKKHTVSSINELLAKKEQLEIKVQHVQNADEILRKKTKEIEKTKHELDKLSNTIHKNRNQSIPSFIKQLEKILANLEMNAVRFKIDLIKQDDYFINGKDVLSFLISTNKGTDFIPIKKGPSGGEMSRIMLAVKTILSNYIELPTIIFDEIDTGVSGEVSNKIAAIMLQMSSNMQVISITHLPQIAAKGEQHYKVYKSEINQQVQTNIKRLSNEERLEEIAEMLGGKQLTESALAHAKQLLGK